MKKIKNETKITIYIILVIVLIGIVALEIFYNKNSKKGNMVYSKEANLSYITYLKNNSHYEDNYLENDYNYVASLIDYFKLDFNYTYTLTEKIDYELEYEVIGYLDIYDSENMTKPIEKKQYTIVEKTSEKNNSQVIKTDILDQKIYYEDYNSIVQSWKREIAPSATLKIEFKVNWKGHSKKLNKDISDSYTNTFEIPISEKIITITKPASIKDTGYIHSGKKASVLYIGILVVTILCLVLVFVNLVYLIIKFNKEKSKYEQKIKKILREFDRAITEAKGRFKLEKGEKAIEVCEFMELMDVHDNVHQPIIYYKTSVNKSTFVVRNGKEIYYTVITRDEFE